MSEPLTDTDPWWREQVAAHMDSLGRHADPSACHTCRDAVADSKQVEHPECAQRALLVEPPDMPDWELIISMTDQEKADLPARFHIPRFDDCGVPNSWLCAVCWGDGWSTQWPCAAAVKGGAQVFTPQYEAEQHVKRMQAEITELRAQLVTAERQCADLDRRLGEVEHLLPALGDDVAGVPA